MRTSGPRKDFPRMRAALRAAQRGWPVFPVVPGSKVPAIRDWPERATTDTDTICRWWAEWPYNVGIATGPAKLLVLDLDDAKGREPPPEWAGVRHGLEVLARLERTAGETVPRDTFTVVTPSGGVHLYYRRASDSDLRNSQSALGWLIDTRGDGGAVVGAGSIRMGHVYRVVNGVSPALLPEWLAQVLTPPPAPEPGTTKIRLSGSHADAYVAACLRGEAKRVAEATLGSRHGTLVSAAACLGSIVGAGQLDWDTAARELYQAASPHIGVDDFTEREARKTIEDGLRWGAARPRRMGV